jgi:hypothetical protein
MIDENTFGKNPAAKFLARELNKINDQKLNTIAGHRITSTSTAVGELVTSYDNGHISLKTFSFIINLMRTNIIETNNPPELVYQLIRNIQLSYIRSSLRKAEIAKRIDKSTTRKMKNAKPQKMVVYVDKSTGVSYNICSSFDGSFIKNKVPLSHIQDKKTSTLLSQKSDARCLRQGKPHMLVG